MAKGAVGGRSAALLAMLSGEPGAAEVDGLLSNEVAVPDETAGGSGATDVSMVGVFLSHRKKATNPTRASKSIAENAFFFISRGVHESKIGRREPSEIGKNRGEIRRTHSEPTGDRCEILVGGGGGNPSTGVGIIGPLTTSVGNFPNV